MLQIIYKKNMQVPKYYIFFQIVLLGSLEKIACKSVENVNLVKHVTLYLGCVQMDVKTTWCLLIVKVAFYNLFNRYRVNEKRNKEYIEMFKFIFGKINEQILNIAFTEIWQKRHMFQNADPINMV